MTVLYGRFFESGDLNEGWQKEHPDGRASAIQPTTGHRRNGSWGCKLDLFASDNFATFGARAELIPEFGMAGGYDYELFNTTRWYGWSIKLDGSAYGYDNEPEIISQWHQKLTIAADGKTPPLALWIQQGKYKLRFRGSEIFWQSNQIVDQWVDFVAQIKWHNTTGFINFWVNGVQVASRSNIKTCTPAELGAYFKFGIYKWRWKLLNGPSDVAYRRLWVDDLRVGDENSSFEEVGPSGAAPTDQPAPGPPPPANPNPDSGIRGVKVPHDIYIPERIEAELAPNFGSSIINSINDAVGFFLQAPKTGSIRRIHFRTGTVTTGAVIDVRLETLLSTGLPSGSLLAANTRVNHNIDASADNAWHRTNVLDADAPVTLGQHFALVLKNPPSNPGNMGISFFDRPFSSANWAFPDVRNFNGSTWGTSLAQIPVCALEYSDGTFAPMLGILPLKLMPTREYDAAGFGGVNEVLLGIKLKFPVRISKVWAYLTTFSADGFLNLYNKDGGIIQQIPINSHESTNDSEAGIRYFDLGENTDLDSNNEAEEEFEDVGFYLQANTQYYLGLQCTTTGTGSPGSILNMRAYYGEIYDPLIQTAWPWYEELTYHERIIPGPFTKIDNRRPFFGIVINEFFENIGPFAPAIIDVLVELGPSAPITFDQPAIEQPIAASIKRIFPSNWSETEVDIDTVWSTDVIESETIAEERRSLAPRPYRRLRARLTGVDQEESQKIINFLSRRTANRIEVPIYSDQTELSVGCTDVDTVIQCDTRYRRFFVGQRILVLDWNPDVTEHAIFPTILSFDPTSITLTAATGSAFNKGAKVFPLLVAEKTLAQEADLITDYNVDLILDVNEVIGNLALDASVLTGLPPGEPTFNSLPIFTIPPDWSINQRIELVKSGNEYGQGRGVVINPKGRRNKFLFEIDILNLDRASFWRCLNFFDSRRGRAFSFWYVNPANIFIPTAVTPTYIEIKKTSELTDLQAFYDYVVLKIKAATDPFIRKINSVTDQGAVFRINLVTELPSSYTLPEIQYCTSGHLSRFDEDVLREKWITNTCCQISGLKIIDLLDEKTITIPFAI